MLLRRKSIRLKHYDYSEPGDYFITICTQNRKCLFGEVIDGEMILNKYGEIIKKCWLELKNKFPNIYLDEFIIIPNHLHAIITILCDDDVISCRGGVTPPLQNKKPTLGQIIAFFKYQSTKEINELLGNPGNPLWQRNYYEHIIRDEKELEQIRIYIISNPQMWELDRNNPKNFL